MIIIKAQLKDEDFLESVRTAEADKEIFHFWWLGQSGFLIKWLDHHLLFDPYLSDSLSLKYALTDKPHTRMSEQVVLPGAMNFVDIVTSSHNHTDHLDGHTLSELAKVNPAMKLIIPEANREFVADRLQCNPSWPVGLDAGKSTTLGPFTFHGIPAAHNKIDKNAAGQCLYLSYVVQFGKWTLYHSGDTLKYRGMEKWLSSFAIDVAFLPINGNVISRRVAGNMNAWESAALARALNVKLAVPHHYHMFTFNTENPLLFKQACKDEGQAYYIPQHGELCTYDSGNIRDYTKM